VPLDPTSTPRRDFLTRVATTAAVVVAGSACASPLAAASAANADRMGHGRQSPKFDDSWTSRVRAAAHRAVFDSPGISDGLALEHATVFMDNYHDQFGTSDADTVPVIVMRHQGTVLALGDEVWAKYELGAYAKVNDPTTGAAATRNPFVRVLASDKNGLIEPGSTLPALQARGAVLLVCNRALKHFASLQAKQRNVNADDVMHDFISGLVPGVIVQPSGVYAVLRAQEAGCVVMRST
jgi:intracellular sulfur oxidation DsrE/DsrF family protein